MSDQAAGGSVGRVEHQGEEAGVHQPSQPGHGAGALGLPLRQIEPAQLQPLPDAGPLLAGRSGSPRRALPPVQRDRRAGGSRLVALHDLPGFHADRGFERRVLRPGGLRDRGALLGPPPQLGFARDRLVQEPARPPGPLGRGGGASSRRARARGIRSGSAGDGRALPFQVVDPARQVELARPGREPVLGGLPRGAGRGRLLLGGLPLGAPAASRRPRRPRPGGPRRASGAADGALAASGPGGRGGRPESGRGPPALRAGGRAPPSGRRAPPGAGRAPPPARRPRGARRPAWPRLRAADRVWKVPSVPTRTEPRSGRASVRRRSSGGPPR